MGAALLAAGIGAGSLWFWGEGSLDLSSRPGLAAATRNTGRLSLAWFSVLWLRWAFGTRVPERQLFGALAASHAVHLGFIFGYLRVIGAPPLTSMAGGMFGYCLILVAPLLQRWGSPRTFRRLAWLYFPYLWLVFILTYLPRALGKLEVATTDPRWAWSMLAWLGCLLLAGVALRIYRRPAPSGG